MAERHARVCPWWIGYLLACPLRRLRNDPVQLLSPYVRPGMTVLEPGPGMGFFTLDMARLVGPQGLVVAVDIQPRMLARLERRAAQQALLGRIQTRLAREDSLGLADLAGEVDFVLAFAVVHEMPSPAWFFREVSGPMKPGARILVAEPKGHVKLPAFEEELAAAAPEGLSVVERPVIGGNLAAVLRKV
jgi:SAM-dependent methyltransferase